MTKRAGSKLFESDIDWDFVEKMRKKIVQLQFNRIVQNSPRKKRTPRFEISIIDHDQELPLPHHQNADISESKKQRCFDDDHQDPEYYHDSKREIFMRNKSITSNSDHITDHDSDNVKKDDDGEAKPQLQKEKKVINIVEDKDGHGWERLLIQKETFGFPCR